MRAIVSVTDKNGLLELVSALLNLGWQVDASSGTAAYLKENGLKVRDLSELTGFTNLLEGRVKTLHPAVFAPVLADPSRPKHLEDLSALGMEPASLVVVNFYRFGDDPQIENIDIGGPALARAAAKNYQNVGVLTDPADYEWVVEEISKNGGLSASSRLKLAAKAFELVRAYDESIAAHFLRLLGQESEELPIKTAILLTKTGPSLRYGENPHQQAALYESSLGADHWSELKQLGGRELSYLNILDSDAAWKLVHEVSSATSLPTFAIIKHMNPCGLGADADPVRAYKKALSGDEQAAFGGIVAYSGAIDEDLAAAIAQGPQADVVVALSFSEAAARTLLERRKSTRLLALPAPKTPEIELRQVGNHFLIQKPDMPNFKEEQAELAAGPEPSPALLADAALAYAACARGWSNSITIARDLTLVGTGFGQPSRVFAAQIAAGRAGERARGAAAASDAFFPFPDGLEVLAKAGVSLVVAPSGSIRDKEVAARANELGISLLFVKQRHFRH